MSTEYCLFASRCQIPDRDSWQAAIRQVGADLMLPTDLEVLRHSGYLPVRFGRSQSGFELHIDESRSYAREFGERIRTRDVAMIFVVRGDDTEVAAALWAIAALAKHANGLLLLPDADRLIGADEALILAQQQMPMQGHEHALDDEFTAGPRRSRKGDALDDALGKTILPILLDAGMREHDPYTFVRRVAGGDEYIGFDVYDDYFLALIACAPDYIADVTALFPPIRAGMPRIPHWPLAPTVVLRSGRSKFYPFAREAKLRSSMRLLEQGMRNVAFQWLEELRDPAVYADRVDVPIIHKARAYEAAGHLGEAMYWYQRELDGTHDFLNDCESEDEFCRLDSAKVLVYAALKLGQHTSLAERLMSLGGFRLSVSRLADIGTRP